MWQSLVLMWSLLLSVTLLMLAAGLFGTFIALRASLEGFPREITGMLMSAYYAGLIVGTLRCGPLINRIGHIRAFAAFCAVNAFVTLLFTFVTSAPVWLLLRAVFGFNMAGMFMVAESWLNDKADGGNRGVLIALYMMACYSAAGGGQFVLNLVSLDGDQMFSITAMLFALAVIPVAVTHATHPAPVEASRFKFRQLYRISPLSVIGCFLAGMAAGALYGLGAIYGSDIGLSVAGISQFMGAFFVSGLLLQMPIGRLSDRYDRRWVLTLVAIVATGFAALLMLGELLPLPGLLLLVLIYGSFTLTLQSLCIAYANDYIEPQDMVAASGGMLMSFSVGAVIGPVGAAGLMHLLGPAGLFAWSALMIGLLVLFSLYRMQVRTWAPVADKDPFVPLPGVSGASTALESDPRSQWQQLSLELESHSDH